MGASLINPCRKPKHLLGLTLIEVLVALAIISIAMTAVIKAASQNIRGTNYLQDKTIATWVGQEVLNQIRVDVLVVPNGNKLKEKAYALNKEWYWEASEETTTNKRIKKIEVNVFKSTDENTNNASPIVTLIGYVYAKD